MTGKLRRAFAAGPMALAALVPHQASAQAGPSSVDPAGRWGLSLAASHQGVRDEIASPLRETGFGPSFGLLYRSRGSRSDWGVGVSYGGPSLSSPSGASRNSSEDVHDFILDLHYLRRLSAPEDARFAVWVGAGSHVRALVRIHHYDVFGSETYADGFAPLEVQGMWAYAASGGVISGRLAVSAFSVVARDPFSGTKGDPPDIEVMGPVTVPMARHILSFRFRMGSSFEGVLSHELGYLRYPEPRHMVMTVQDLCFTLEWKR